MTADPQMSLDPDPAGQCRPPGSGAVTELVILSLDRSQPLVAALLSDLGGGAQWSPHGPASGAELAVGVYRCPEEDDDYLRVAQWAAAAGVPFLSVSMVAGGARIGPLALPGRAGCGHCARRRMSAVGQLRRPRGGVAVPATLLRQQVQDVLAGGAGWNRLLDHVLVPDRDAGGFTRHRVIPLSHCPVCGGAPAAAARSTPAPLPVGGPPGELLEALAGWVDPITGVIPLLTVDPLPGPLPVLASATPAPASGWDGERRPLAAASGKGLSMSQATISAVGEAVERYAASTVPADRVVWARPDDLEGEVLDPRQFPLYSDEQYRRPGFPYPPFDAGVLHPWMLGHWLGRETTVWVPAVMALLRMVVRPEHALCQGTSNGLAASGTLDDAELRATLELVERDAFLAAWLTGTRPTPVRVDGVFGEIVARLGDLGVEVEVSLLPSAVGGSAAVAVAIARGDGVAWPGATVGLGSRLDPAGAVGAAVLEVTQATHELGQLLRSGRWPAPPEPSSVRHLIDQAAYYFPRVRSAALDRIRGVGAPVAVDQIAVPTRAGFLAALAAEGIRVAVIDVTPPDVASGPFRVARAVSPDLQPLTFGYGLDRVPVARLAGAGPTFDPTLVHPLS